MGPICDSSILRQQSGIYHLAIGIAPYNTGDTQASSIVRQRGGSVLITQPNRRRVWPLEPDVVKEGKLLWALIRATQGDLGLTNTQSFTLRVDLQRIVILVIPQLQLVENEASGGQGWEDPVKHPFRLCKGIDDENVRCQLDELCGTRRDILRQLPGDHGIENPFNPVIPVGP